MSDQDYIADDYYRMFADHWDKRKTNTCVMFADIEGSTKLKEADPIQGLFLIREFFRLVNSVITVPDYNSQVVKHLGDGVLIRFDGPDGPLNAINAAIALQEECDLRNNQCGPQSRICINIGINAGDVIDLDGDDPHGVTVDLAARLVSLAKGGQILISAEITKLVVIKKLRSKLQTKLNQPPESLLSEPAQYRKLKGIRDLVSVVEVRVFESFRQISWPLESLIEFKELHVRLTDILDIKGTITKEIQDNLRLWKRGGVAKARSVWRDILELKKGVYQSLCNALSQWSFVNSDLESQNFVDSLQKQYNEVKNLLRSSRFSSTDSSVRKEKREEVDEAIDDWFRIVANYQKYADERIKLFLTGS